MAAASLMAAGSKPRASGDDPALNQSLYDNGK